jgi:hypothetical protein
MVIEKKVYNSVRQVLFAPSTNKLNKRPSGKCQLLYLAVFISSISLFLSQASRCFYLKHLAVFTSSISLFLSQEKIKLLKAKNFSFDL